MEFGFDTAALTAYLVSNLPDEFAAPIELKKFEIGQSNPTFLLLSGAGTHEPRKFVLRKKPAGTLLPTAHAVEREALVLRALRRTDSGVPVPRVVTLVEDVSVIGTAFYVMDFCEGAVYQDLALDELPPPERWACFRDAMRAIARLHAVDIDAAGLGSYGKREGNFYPRQVARMARTSRAQELAPGSAGLPPGSEGVPPLPHLDELCALFRGRMPPDVCTVIHGDYKIGGWCLVWFAPQPKAPPVVPRPSPRSPLPLCPSASHLSHP
jgi:aminoglycoside phosphotransferase (APT) family kinase protein